MIRKSKTYYVSSIRGNDKNDGLTQETPFRTLQQLTGRELEPGDRILLERGSVFEYKYLHGREILCTSQNGQNRRGCSGTEQWYAS